MTIQLTKEELELLVEGFTDYVYSCYGKAPDKLQKLLAKLEVILMEIDKNKEC